MTQEATARPLMVYGEDGPQISTVDESGQPKKLHLHIRRHNIEMELVKMKLPHDAKELIQLALEERKRGLEGKYNLVCIWIRAQNKGEFWRKFDCRTLDELLAKLDLPNGRILGVWESAVRLFDKETFLLVGDEALGYMMTLVSQHQKGAKQGLVAFQEIFEAYCAKYQAFDSDHFREVVHWYVNTKYVRPKGQEGKSKPIRLVRRDVFRRPTAEPSGESRTARALPPPTERACHKCQYMEMQHRAVREHFYRLEQVIRQHLGDGYVPPRPKIVEDIMNEDIVA